MTKVCSKCGEEKDISEFHKKKNSIDGHHYDCKECRKIERKNYYKNNKESIKNYGDNYRKENKVKIKKMKNKYYKNNKHKIKEYHNKLYKYDLNYKLSKNARNRMRGALKKNWKSGHTLELLGCSISHFKLYLELQFPEGMSWDNYGKWHIDHIIPCSSFDLSDPEEQKKCFHYSNLQPLWAEDNLKKGDKIDKGM